MTATGPASLKLRVGYPGAIYHDMNRDDRESRSSWMMRVANTFSCRRLPK